MRDRATIRRTGPGQWTVVRPRAGFAPPEVHTTDSAAAAWRWLATATKPRGGHSATDRAANYADAIGSYPRWDPWRYRWAPKPWR
jgi:hypothetical protein